MSTNNVIKFPEFERAITQNLNSKRNINKNMNSIKAYHVDQAITFICPLIFTYLSQAGFDFEDSDEKNIAFIVEAFRSVLSQKQGLFHPFQELADAILKDNKKTGELELVKSVNMKFSKKSEVN